MAIYIGTPNGKKSITDIYIGDANGNPKRLAAAYIGGADNKPKQVYVGIIPETYVFYIEGKEYTGDTRYKTWGEWLNSKYNKDFEYHEESGWSIHKTSYQGLVYNNDTRVGLDTRMDNFIAAETWKGLVGVSCIIYTSESSYDRIFEISGNHFNPTWPNTIVYTAAGDITYKGTILREGTFQSPGFKISRLDIGREIITSNEIDPSYFTINGKSFDAFENTQWHSMIDSEKFKLGSDYEQIMYRTDKFYAPIVCGAYDLDSYVNYIGMYDSIQPGAYHTPFIQLEGINPLGEKLYVPNTSGYWSDFTGYYDIRSIAINYQESALGFYLNGTGYYFTAYDDDRLVNYDTEYYDGQRYYVNQIR